MKMFRIITVKEVSEAYFVTAETELKAAEKVMLGNVDPYLHVDGVATVAKISAVDARPVEAAE